MKCLKYLYFHSYYHAYCVEELNGEALKKPSELPNCHPCLIVAERNLTFVASKYILKIENLNAT